MPRFCKPDFVIYHMNSVQKAKISAVTLQTDSLETDCDVSIEDVDDVVLMNSMGCKKFNEGIPNVNCIVS